LRRIGDVEAHHIAGEGEAIEVDLGHAQLGAHVLGEVGQPLLVEGVGVDLHEQI